MSHIVQLGEEYIDLDEVQYANFPPAGVMPRCLLRMKNGQKLDLFEDEEAKVVRDYLDAKKKA